MISLRDLINNSEMGLLLGEFLHQQFPALAYLMDFVHMVYKPSSVSEHKVSSFTIFHLAVFKLPCTCTYIHTYIQFIETPLNRAILSQCKNKLNKHVYVLPIPIEHRSLGSGLLRFRQECFLKSLKFDIGND